MSARFCQGAQCTTKRLATAEFIRQALAAEESLVAQHPGLEVPIAHGSPNATVRVFWPGAPPVEFCESCVAWAREMAAALGFTLHEASIITGEESSGPSRTELLEVE